MVIKKFIKYFVILFLLSFILLNWVDYGWLFNYRVVGDLASDVLPLAEEEIVEETVLPMIEEVETPKFENNTIRIPSINISAPILFYPDPTGNDILTKALDRGTVHFPSSVLPGEAGQTIILGHSAPEGWPKIKYDWVFSQVNLLQVGDEIFVYYNNQEYIYLVKDTIFLEKGEEVPAKDNLSSQNSLILLSCWPPGKDYKRIGIVSELLTN
jgi:LPXTG-site transpeptidase (sortase) family protein